MGTSRLSSCITVPLRRESFGASAQPYPSKDCRQTSRGTADALHLPSTGSRRSECGERARASAAKLFLCCLSKADGARRSRNRSCERADRHDRSTRDGQRIRDGSDASSSSPALSPAAALGPDGTVTASCDARALLENLAPGPRTVSPVYYCYEGTFAQPAHPECFSAVSCGSITVLCQSYRLAASFFILGGQNFTLTVITWTARPAVVEIS